MREIRLMGLPDEQRELTGGLMMAALAYAENEILIKARSSSVVGIVMIDGRELYLSVDLRPVTCDCRVGVKKKNYDECALCGGKWSTRKKAER